MKLLKHNAEGGENRLSGYLSPVGVWALSFGAAVGWGAFAMPGSTFLPAAGPLGTAIGIFIGAAVMFLIGVSYHYLIARFPDAGGSYAYAREAFGHDHAFLAGWFMLLTYVAILWANATALALIARNVFGGFFQFGFHYSVAGFDVYFGEVLLSAFAILVFGLICAFLRLTAKWVQIIAAFVLIAGAVFCFVAAVTRSGFSVENLKPAFAPNGSHAGQVIAIVAISPWAYVGFESVAHSSEEFKPGVTKKRLFFIIVTALFTAAAAYTALELLAVTALPEGVADWTGFDSDVHGLPTFYAARAALGAAGTAILGVTVLGGIITGIIANYVAASRLICSMARDGLFPKVFSRINSFGVPGNAVLFIMCVSLVIPFFGRIAIGWIVDVTTVGAAVAYAYVSASALRIARREGKKRVVAAGAAGLMISLFFIVYFLIPEIGGKYSLSSESYMILVAWCLIGILVMHILIRRGGNDSIGRSSAVWAGLVVIIMLVSMLWVRQTLEAATDTASDNAIANLEQTVDELGLDMSDERAAHAEEYLDGQFGEIRRVVVVNNLVQMGLIAASLAFILRVFMIVQNRKSAAEAEKLAAERSSRAKSAFLSNMSHDIRTPMNAIIGYTTIALREPGLTPAVGDYLEKIDFSSRHLLSLINDVLDMSRIESGKMELDPEPADVVQTMEKLNTVFRTQMEEKKIRFTVSADKVADRYLVFDENRVMRVLLNLTSNAYKYTPEGGSVDVALVQTGRDGDLASFRITVADTGIGMSPEFVKTIFRAFEREHTKTVSDIQGTGLGMAITKSFVDLMGGDISVESTQGVGTTFTVTLSFPVTTAEAAGINAPAPESGAREGGGSGENAFDFAGKKILIVDDNAINREIAAMLLDAAGFACETAENGKEAYDRIAKEAPERAFDAVLMDVLMPEMNGYEATEAIRKLEGPAGSVPIIAASANAFAEDVQASKDAGMDAHVAKPIEINVLLETLKELLK